MSYFPDGDKLNAICATYNGRNRAEHRCYAEFLQSLYWEILSNSMKVLAKGQCRLCGSNGDSSTLNVHHLTYDHVGEEYPDHLEDLIVICKHCHEEVHKNQRKALERIAVRIKEAQRTINDMGRLCISVMSCAVKRDVNLSDEDKNALFSMIDRIKEAFPAS